jgi:hypothetical protein
MFTVEELLPVMLTCEAIEGISHPVQNKYSTDLLSVETTICEY